MPREFEKLDANEQIFFNQELTKVKTKAYDVKYPELDARRLIPVSFDAGAGAETISYKQYDITGFAKIVNSYANDFPRVDIKGKKFTGQIKSLGDSYGYNVQEIRAAQMAGLSLEQRRANAARRCIMQLESEVAMFGDADYDLGGFLTNPNIPSGTVPADGNGASTLWTDKTPELILRDLNLCANAPYVNTHKVEYATRLLLPLDKYTFISTTQFSEKGETTILQVFLKNQLFVKTVEPLLECSAANSNGLFQSDFMIAYNPDPDKLTLEVPVDFEQFPPQEKGLEFEVYCHERCGGVIWYYPLSAQIYDGI